MKELDRSSRHRLTRFSARFFAGETLFDRIGRAVCRAECLSRKEFFESWEVARRIRRRFRGGPVFELAAGHGFLALLLVLLERLPGATCVDRRKPPSHDRLAAALAEDWPGLAGRVVYEEREVVAVELPDGARVVSVHACGALTDVVLERATARRAVVAVLPCCHDASVSDDAGLSGWMDGALAIDAARAVRLRDAGYRVVTRTIPADVTPKNRLILGWPDRPSRPGGGGPARARGVDSGA